ncbi:phage tail assembly chaperone [Pseudomonas sp. G2-4]|uniref:phage tail assembly chaperone n=1 Tax=Pseudomonas sp. G2-4 TaxID=1506334 RepID=UPI0024BBBD5C|nr:phage tail assembly chaperone [Pseudomonas sp. G2-4]WHS62258.1 phage tail assembly chaperone [Pseudomonas sp. G2-4]
MWARIENGTVVETTDVDPTERFHPDLLWQACPTDTRPDWTVVDGNFSPPPAGDASEQVNAERVWRNLELQATEWLVTRHRDEQDLALVPTLATEQFAELLTYRQSLREWPQTDTFPNIESRPVAPSWIAEQVQ